MSIRLVDMTNVQLVQAFEDVIAEWSRYTESTSRYVPKKLVERRTKIKAELSRRLDK